MELFDRLVLNSKYSKDDIECERESVVSKYDIPVTEASLPNGQKIKMLKTMLTSACEKNCNYCAFRAGLDVKTATFLPDELAKIFMQIYDKKLVEGLFLSSGIVRGGVSTQDKLIATAELLRKKYKYQGYIHLKIMPGIEKEQLFESMHYASRISINLEAPNGHRLSLLAPKKTFQSELIEPIKWAAEIRRTKSPSRTWNGRWPSGATQFVIGAVGETDLELISTSEHLFNRYKLRRIYYSRFNPIENTPLEDHPPENLIRKNRLYQASYLLRDYQFSLEDMPFNQKDFLPQDIDPKMAWAQNNLLHDPIEINNATRKQLLRIPGIGPLTSDIILKARQSNLIKNSQQLKKMGISTKRASNFILLNGKRPTYQPQLM
jgi:predicted DNA-binding helix-hairpin-helix protein